MKTMQGIAASGGIARGVIFFMKPDAALGPDTRVEDSAAEIDRFYAARAAAAGQLRLLYEKTRGDLGEKEAAIFEIDAMMLEDEDFSACVVDRIETEKTKAEYAVQAAALEFSAMLAETDDEYIAGRAADIQDISGRLIGILSGARAASMLPDEPVILAAEDLLPSQTQELDRTKILGIATARGSSNSHTAILARSMNIPAVIGLGVSCGAELHGREAVIDGDAGLIHIEPDAAACERAREGNAQNCARRAALNALKGKENRSKGGRCVEVFANAASLADIDRALENDAGGIGLFRSEFLYLQKKSFPAEEELFAVYKAAALRMGGKKIIIRTLDIGADKGASYFAIPPEENPALGMRAIRICLTRPAIFKTQLRAILRASAFGNIAIMLPMIAEPEELARAQDIISAQRDELAREGLAFDRRLQVGIMIETPAAAIMSDELARQADFFSIGSNDLTQYTLAADRQNAALSRYFPQASEAVLRLIDMTARNAHARGIWVGICGEMGADTELTRRFMDMGIDEFSVNASSVLPLREKIRELD